LAIVAVTAAVMVGGARLVAPQLTLANLAEREAELRALQAAQPGLFAAAAFAIYVAVTGLSLPGAAGLTLVTGWLFGVARGTLLVSFASTLGATIAFLLSRFLFRDAVERRFGARLRPVQDAVARDGAWHLFALRLIPAAPFFLVNLAMGLTSLRVWTYWWVSQLGMLPATIVYVAVGASVADGLRGLAERGIGGVLSVRLWLALAALGLLPLLLRVAAPLLLPSRRRDDGLL